MRVPSDMKESRNDTVTVYVVAIRTCHMVMCIPSDRRWFGDVAYVVVRLFHMWCAFTEWIWVTCVNSYLFHTCNVVMLAPTVTWWCCVRMHRRYVFPGSLKRKIMYWLLWWGLSCNGFFLFMHNRCWERARKWQILPFIRTFHSNDFCAQVFEFVE